MTGPRVFQRNRWRAEVSLTPGSGHSASRPKAIQSFRSAPPDMTDHGLGEGALHRAEHIEPQRTHINNPISGVERGLAATVAGPKKLLARSDVINRWRCRWPACWRSGQLLRGAEKEAWRRRDKVHTCCRDRPGSVQTSRSTRQPQCARQRQKLVAGLKHKTSTNATKLNRQAKFKRSP